MSTLPKRLVKCECDFLYQNYNLLREHIPNGKAYLFKFSDVQYPYIIDIFGSNNVLKQAIINFYIQDKLGGLEDFKHYKIEEDPIKDTGWILAVADSKYVGIAFIAEDDDSLAEAISDILNNSITIRSKKSTKIVQLFDFKPIA